MGRVWTLLAAVVIGGCAVDSDGVIRAVAPDEDVIVGIDAEAPDAGECGALLERLRTAAVDLVGPTGFIGAQQGFDDPFFGGRGVFFEDFAVPQQGSTAAVGSGSVVVGDLLAIERGGRVYLIGPDGAALGSIWLDALPEQRWPAPSTGLLGRSDDLVAISPAVPLIDESGDRYVATVIQRIDVTDPTDPVIAERLTVRGEIAGSEVRDGAIRMALNIPAPRLDFLFASTEGGEQAATEHNRTLLAETTLEDWLGGYELTSPGDDGVEETTTGLLGGCDVLAPRGADAALGSTVLLDMSASASLVDAEAHTLLGQGRVSYHGDRVFVLSPRSHAVGFTEPGQPGTPRVVISRVVPGDDGPQIDATGILAGSLSSLDAHPVGDEGLVVFTVASGEFGNGVVEASSFVVEGEDLRRVGEQALPLDQWDQLRTDTVGDRLLISGSQRSALLDLDVLSDIDVTPIEPVWDRGDRVGAPEFTGFGDDLLLSTEAGPVSQQFGGVQNFLRSLGLGEFGFGWQPWLEQQGRATMRVVEGDPFEGTEIASFETTAFALWPVSADSEAGRVVAGVLGLVDESGDLFDGMLVLELDGTELVETGRWSFEPPDPENFGARECTQTDVAGLVSDILGLWNQVVLTCEEGQSGGMVGHTCVGFQVPEISPEQIQAWFGGPNPDAEETIAELKAAVAAGASLQSCTPRQVGDPNVPRSYFEDDSGGWVVSGSAVHRVDADGQVTESTALEPPYQL